MQHLDRRVFLLLLLMFSTVFTACDPNNTRVNEAPNLTKPGNQENRVGDDVILKIEASDPQNDKLNFFASGLPSGLSMNPVGLISGSPVQEENVLVTIRVDDGKGNRREAVFGWRILAAEPLATD